jgi:Transposase DDE domain
VNKTKTKRPYRVRNWREYNKALVARGSLTLWIDQQVLDGWNEQEHRGTPGCPRTYSDRAIEAALVLRSVYHLPLRATQGLMQSIVGLLGASLDVMQYSTLSRRQQTLDIEIPAYGLGARLHVLVDASGVKVSGEGEWKVRQHGWAKRRTWRKLHLAIDAETEQVVAALVTTPDWSDDEVLPELLDQIEEDLEAVGTDGAYDTKACWAAVAERGARAIIPPRRTAVIWQHGNSKGPPVVRDEHLRAIRARGRRAWKQESGYHRRSLVEAAFSRLKRIFGGGVSGRTLDSQHCELMIRCVVMNRMSALGMPDSHAV